MRIGFDYRPCQRPNSRRRGIGRFTQQLALHLLAEDPANQYLLYTLSDDQLGPLGERGMRQLPSVRRPGRLNWLLDRWTMPRQIGRDSLDLFHATDFTSIPVLKEVQVWAYVHDLIPFLFWEETRRRVPRDFAYALQSSLGRAAQADLVITVSERSKRDICRMMGLPAGRVRVVYQNCDESLRPVERDLGRQEVEKRHGIASPFLFYLGGSDFRKNVPLLVRAFAEIRRQGYDGQLVLAGETFGWSIPEVRQVQDEVARLNLEKAVCCPGFVPDAELAFFYSACDMFVFPSLYEGFGIPVLEAMRCGAPVLAGRAGAVPEVAGDAAAYFDPRSEESLLEAFCEVWGREGKLEEMRRKGLDRAEFFSWKKSARQMAEWTAEVSGRGAESQRGRGDGEEVGIQGGD